MAVSVAAILRHQEPNGAFVASRDFATYQYCWLRDGSFSAYALDRAGEHDASGRFHIWVARAIARIGPLIDDAIERHARGAALDLAHMPPARFALDGATVADDWPNFQIDGYGTWLWALDQHLEATAGHAVPEELLDSVERVGRYLAAFATTRCYDVWEESGSARHTSTLASVYAGLLAGARMLGLGEMVAHAEIVRAAARAGTERLGRYAKSSESDEVDASLLWLATPFDLAHVADSHFLETVRAIEEQLTFEGGLRRYPGDIYFGSGAWPVLTASLGWHYVAAGDEAAARRCKDWVQAHIDKAGRLAEQYGGERRDPAHYSAWVDRWGTPAADLAWSHAMHVVLCAELDGRAG
jgi:GH15 family glucan-1,4-alpha-glucosidase